MNDRPSLPTPQAMQGNSERYGALLQVFAQAGCGFDIVSGGELERVLAVEAARVVVC